MLLDSLIIAYRYLIITMHSMTNVIIISPANILTQDSSWYYISSIVIIINRPHCASLLIVFAILRILLRHLFAKLWIFFLVLDDVVRHVSDPHISTGLTLFSYKRDLDMSMEKAKFSV